MIITFTPMRRDDTLTLSKAGEVLTINGEAFDLSGIPDGATLPCAAVACDWLASDIERVGDTIHLTLILPHGADAPQSVLFPQSIHITHDGPIALPPHHSSENAA